MIEIFILSIIQGLTEFLPISSSSHLIIISNFLNFENDSLSMNVSLHIGSFIAICFYFRNDIFNFIKNKILFLRIIISSIPVMLVGYLLIKLNLIIYLRDIKIIAWTTIIFGFVLLLSDKFETKKKIDKNFTLKSAIFIGCFQILSLIPGVSRSGITISAARFLKFDRYDSAQISFLLSVPTLAAVSFFGLTNLVENNNIIFTKINLFSIFLSFLFSYITIKFFLNYIKKFTLIAFVIYRIILGSVLLIVAYL
ncbi:undecaprenyl-diphosphate phosphatase [Pelagibacteraceae bacterium]|nr:undecaprenyl-diphosphate phosphatase [Pelagibacteraceae bacterium]